MVTCADWRDADPGQITPLYAAERGRWLDALAWDPQTSWAVVEDARSAGVLPGLLARDRSGNVVGWAFYLLRGEVLHVGALVADTAAVIRSLLDAVWQSPEASLAKGLSCFVFPTSSALQTALVRSRFSVRRYPYLRRALTDDRWPGPPSQDDAPAPGAGSEPRIRTWRTNDGPATIRLLAVAYAGHAASRCFAPHGRLDEWAHYVGQLLQGPGCGSLLPAASFAVEDPVTDRLVGVILTTSVADSTAHVAQVAVDATARRRGLGQALVARAGRAARDAGHDRLTLMVAEENTGARRVYDRLGFEPCASFLYGSRAKPWRLPTAPGRARDRDWQGARDEISRVGS